MRADAVLRQSLLVLITFLSASCTSYRPTSSYVESLSRSTGPDFYLQAFNYFTDTRPRVDLYVAIDNTSLQFTKAGEQYVATYDVSIRVRAEGDDRIISEKSWTETVTENDYDATLARVHHISPRSFSLEPGSYTFSAEIADEGSRKTMRHSKTFEVPDYRSLDLRVSSLMVGSHYVVRDGRRSLLPNVGPAMSYVGEPQYVFYEVYGSSPGREITLSSRLQGIGRYEMQPFVPEFYPGVLPKHFPDTLFWAYESTFTTRGTSESFNIPLPALPTGHYRLEITLHEREGQGLPDQHEIRASRTFTLWPYGFPDLVTLDRQIEVLEYVATPEEFKRLKAASTKEEKQKRLAEFWSEHRSRDEYYKRAQYANQYFSCLSEGWRTPFGWTYMVLGPPEQIELLPGGNELWLYTLGSDRTLQLLFLKQEVRIDDWTCKVATMSLNPEVRRELVSQWKISE
jgi:GWxTD domain-containing protein